MIIDKNILLEIIKDITNYEIYNICECHIIKDNYLSITYHSKIGYFNHKIKIKEYNIYCRKSKLLKILDNDN